MAFSGVIFPYFSQLLTNRGIECHESWAVQLSPASQALQETEVLKKLLKRNGGFWSLGGLERVPEGILQICGVEGKLGTPQF